ncbi:FAD-dependent oxidoreductase [bacterium]|nr:FAD-dependent oxidoreductase [bacterium]
MKKYDLTIIGGGTAGCACAYIAGLSGLKTLLIEKNIHLGGAVSSGLVLPAMQSSKNQINTTFFNHLCKELDSLGGHITYQDNAGWFNPELIKIALDRMMNASNVDVLFNSSFNLITVNKNNSFSLNLLPDILSVYIETRYIVDATGNADVAKYLGCEFLEEKLQPSSLRFQMSGVNLENFSNWILELDKDRNVTTVERKDNQIHLSTACTNQGVWALQSLFRQAVKEGVLKDTDCNYFQIFTVAGMPDTINFNCPRIYSKPELNPLNTIEVSKALVDVREAILRISNFCKKYLSGFENAYISNIADELGVRVSRRVRGKYVYTKDDLINGKTFKTPVLIGNYPIDVHSNDKSGGKLERVMQDYQVPIEALMSNDYSNLFVIGRCLSADFEAQAALRIQPSCFSMGEGVAKYICKNFIN